jgi:hypothetical protein
MTRVLFVGQQPETVDFTNPMLPPGMNAERIHAGIAMALKQMAERGWRADLCLLRPDETAGPDVERRLKAQAYDCVVIGAGIRLPPHSLSMFEADQRGAQSRAGRRYRVQHAPRGQRRCCRPLAKGGLNHKAELPSTPRAASGVLCHSTAMATAARGLLRTVVLPPPGPCGRNATYPGNRVDDRLPLFALRLFPRIIFAGWEGDGDMSEDSKGARWPTAKRGTSEGWSDPPIWSPWNFQFPNPNRKRQGHVDREAPANAHARDETE